jgi:hypothetical protein
MCTSMYHGIDERHITIQECSKGYNTSTSCDYSEYSEHTLIIGVPRILETRLCSLVFLFLVTFQILLVYRDHRSCFVHFGQIVRAVRVTIAFRNFAGWGSPLDSTHYQVVALYGSITRLRCFSASRHTASNFSQERAYYRDLKVTTVFLT